MTMKVTQEIEVRNEIKFSELFANGINVEVLDMGHETSTIQVEGEYRDIINYVVDLQLKKLLKTPAWV